MNIDLPTDADPVTVVHADCLDVLRALPDGCVDAVVTDPPYGTGSHPRGKSGGGVSWDRKKVRHGWDNWGTGWFDEAFRVARTVATFCPDTRLAETLALRDNWRLLVWCKSDPMPLWAGTPAFGTEPIVTFGPLQQAGGGNWFVASTPREKRDAAYAGHPYQKPLSLMRWLVGIACPDGGLVLDPFAGSGTTGVAAIAEGRRAILVEKDAGYCDIARRRVAEALGLGKGSLLTGLAQPTLFGDD